MLRLQDLRQRVPSWTSEIAQIIIQKKDREAQRPDQGPKDPKVIRDQDLPPLRIEVEELGAKNRLLSVLDFGRTLGGAGWFSYRYRGQRKECHGHHRDGLHGLAVILQDVAVMLGNHVEGLKVT